MEILPDASTEVPDKLATKVNKFNNREDISRLDIL